MIQPNLRFNSTNLTPLIQCKIQCKHIHAWFAEETEIPRFSVLIDNVAYFIVRQLSRARDATSLVIRRSHADFGIQATGRCGHQIDWDRRGISRIGGFQCIDAALYRVNQSGIERPFDSEPLEAVALFGIGLVADGRLQKYFGEENA